MNLVELKLIADLWNDADASEMDEPELLRYRSNLLGSDLRLTNFGGGNTSAKVFEVDPITGQTVPVLWVKGSGGDLGSIKRSGFATLYLDRLLALKQRYQGVQEEDRMADLYPLCTFGGNPRAASIDTPLHGFLPFPHVDHLHPDWVIAVAASANGPRVLEEICAETGLKLGWLPWKRPGFELGLWLEKAVADRPDLDGIILGSHGLFTWGPTSRQCYLNTLRVVDRIGQFVQARMNARGDQLFGGQVTQTRPDQAAAARAMFPVLRGRVGASIGHFDGGEAVMRFVNSARAKELAWQGTSCPDHFVRTRVRPLFLADLGAIDQAFADYAADYAAYYRENCEPDSPKMRGASPTVILVPGVGMFTFAKNKTEARITGEFYVNAINVMAGATSLESRGRDAASGEDRRQPNERVVDNYLALPAKEAFDIEYWSLEEAKLQRMPPEKEMSRKIVALVGASPGIGRNVAEKLLANGAHLVLVDLNEELASSQCEELRVRFGKEVVDYATANVTDRISVAEALGKIVDRFGGLDALISIAAVFIAPQTNGQLTDEQWRKTYDINVLGSLIVAQAARDVIALQDTTGAVVLVSSANAVVPKKGSVAYDTSKAAVNHLVRELAIELSPMIRINAVAPATVVEGSQMFPRDRVMTSLSKYGIAHDDSETTEALRTKLASFYAERTLLKRPVSPEKVAEAIYLLAGDRIGLTTGHVIPVDAGLWEAFLR